MGGQPIDNIHTIIFPHKNRLSYLTHAHAVVSRVKSLAPDILHVHSAAGFGFWSQFCRIRKTIVSLWGSDILSFGTTLLGKHIMRRTLSSAIAISATSQFLSRETVKSFPFVKERIGVIPFGVEPQPASFAWPIAPPFKLCMLKADREIYGAEHALEAISELTKTNHEIELTLLRCGKNEKNLRRKVSEKNLHGLVTFAGTLPHKEISRFLGQHHALLMPSLSESFGVAALEAQAAGRPVIATDVGGIPEVVLPDRTGILVPPANPEALGAAVKTLSESPPLCRRYGEAGRKFTAEKFPWRRSLEQMDTLYQKVLHAR